MSWRWQPFSLMQIWSLSGSWYPLFLEVRVRYYRSPVILRTSTLPLGRSRRMTGLADKKAKKHSRTGKWLNSEIKLIQLPLKWLWVYLIACFYHGKPRTLEELKAEIRQEISNIDRELLERVDIKFQERLHICTPRKQPSPSRNNFSQLIFLNGIP